VGVSVELRHFDPATVFVSYARKDEMAVVPLERALRERGIHVLRDVHSLPLGGHNVQVLTKLIEDGCDAVLFYITDNFLTSDFIWRYEVPTALARHNRQPAFHIIPILKGISFHDLSVYCSDCGLPSLAAFNAQPIAAETPSPSEAQVIAQRTLRSALAVRVARGGAGEEITICMRTFPYTPPVHALHLDLDWVSAFSQPELPPETWHEELLPALRDVAAALAEKVCPNTVEAWVKARLPAALALGYTFPARGGVRLRLRSETENGVNASGSEANHNPLTVIPTPLSRDSTAAIVELAVSREVTPAVTKWRAHTNFLPRWRIRFEPPNGPSRAALTSRKQAQQWAWQIGDRLRWLWDKEGVDDIHLFLASPVEFAVLVGQQLRDRHPVHIYYGDNALGYRLAYTLGVDNTTWKSQATSVVT
jgi:hypothetical protein